MIIFSYALLYSGLNELAKSALLRLKNVHRIDIKNETEIDEKTTTEEIDRAI
jgi:hypothetical protein